MEPSHRKRVDTRWAIVIWLGMLPSAACGNVATPASEELRDPGPRDGAVDAALHFDGVNDYATAGTARMPQIERPQTLMLWAKPEPALADTPAELQVLFALRRSDWSGIVLSLERGVPLAYNVWGHRELARADAALSFGQWHHVAYVLDAVGSSIYVDGSVVGTGPTPGTNRTPIEAYIGSLDGYADMYRGSLDDLRVYDRAFSAAEVALEASGQPLYDAEPLVLSLPFDEAEGGRCYDRSGLGNHAELGDGVPELMPVRVASDAHGTLR